MNYIFDTNKSINEYSEFIESEYKLEYLNIEDNDLELHSNAFNEFDCLRVPSYDLLDAGEEQILSSKNVTRKCLEDDVLFCSNLRSTCLLNESNINIINEENTMSAKKSDLSMTSHIAEDDSLDSIRFNLNPNTICPSKKNSNIHPDQNELPTIVTTKINHNSKGSGKTRWGRKEDIQAFKTLRQLCKREGISIESFWSQDSAITEKHHYIIFDLVHQHNWKRNTDTMLKRIQCLGQNQTMSVRELKLFRRLNKKAKKEGKEFDLEEVADQFPGKLASTLQKHIKC